MLSNQNGTVAAAAAAAAVVSSGVGVLQRKKMRKSAAVRRASREFDVAIVTSSESEMENYRDSLQGRKADWRRMRNAHQRSRVGRVPAPVPAVDSTPPSLVFHSFDYLIN